MIFFRSFSPGSMSLQVCLSPEPARLIFAVLSSPILFKTVQPDPLADGAPLSEVVVKGF